MPEIEHVYRFRKIQNAWGDLWGELERGEIYLSSPEQLNDPMEGYQDVIWHGDSILWENLIRHYLLLLLCDVLNCAIVKDYPFENPPIDASFSEEHLPTNALRTLYHKICDRFFEKTEFAEIPRQLSRISMIKPISLNRLQLILSSAHIRALWSVVSVLGEARTLPDGWLFPEPDIGAPFNAMLSAMECSAPDLKPNEFEETALISNQIRNSQALGLLSATVDADAALAMRKNHILFAFPDYYVQAISKSLIHSDWYTACFSANCTNASMWSTYADQHRGVSLIFRVEHEADLKPRLPLRDVVGFSASRKSGSQPVEGAIRHQLEKMNYTNKAVEVGFFQFLGNLPAPTLMNTWYANRNRERSQAVEAVFNNTEDWRRKLWDTFHRMATTKLEDWQHEEEYRLVFPDLLGERKEHRVVHYEFSQLDGIVFGLRTSMEDKLKCLRLIDAKCKNANRSDFKFYQMQYHSPQGRLVCMPIPRFPIL